MTLVYLRIMFDTYSKKTGVEIPRCEDDLLNDSGVVCFFYETNSDNDYQTTDNKMLYMGSIPIIDKFVQKKIKDLIDRDKEDKDLTKFLSHFLINEV